MKQVACVHFLRAACCSSVLLLAACGGGVPTTTGQADIGVTAKAEDSVRAFSTTAATPLQWTAPIRVIDIYSMFVPPNAPPPPRREMVALAPNGDLFRIYVGLDNQQRTAIFSRRLGRRAANWDAPQRVALSSASDIEIAGHAFDSNGRQVALWREGMQTRIGARATRFVPWVLASVPFNTFAQPMGTATGLVVTAGNAVYAWRVPGVFDQPNVQQLEVASFDSAGRVQPVPQLDLMSPTGPVLAPLSVEAGGPQGLWVRAKDAAGNGVAYRWLPANGYWEPVLPPPFVATEAQSAIDAAGNVYMLWQEKMWNGICTNVVRRDAALPSSWQMAQFACVPDTPDAVPPKVTLSLGSDGTAALTWVSTDPVSSRIEAAVFRPGMQMWNVLQPLGAPPVPLTQVQAAVGGDGTLIVTWQMRMFDGNALTAYALNRRFEAGFYARQFDPSINLAFATLSVDKLYVAPSGALWAAWSRSDMPGQVATARLDVASGEFVNRFDHFTAGANWYLFGNERGDLVFAWTEATAPNAQTLWQRSFNTQLNMWEPPQLPVTLNMAPNATPFSATRGQWLRLYWQQIETTPEFTSLWSIGLR